MMRILIYINTFLLGADHIAVQIGSISLRVVVLTLMIALLAHVLRKRTIYVSRYQFLVYGLFLGATSLSIPGSLDPIRSMAYFFWMAILAFVQTSYYNFEYRRLGEQEFERIIIIVYRICAVLLIAEFVFRLVVLDGTRPRLFFYEPAHTSIFMIPYLVMALSDAPKGRISNDLALALAAMMVLFSATAFFAVLAALGLTALFLSRSRLTILNVGAISGGGLVALAFAAGLAAHFNLIIGYLLIAENIPQALELILHRSGTRVIRLYYGLEAWQSAPIFGIGAGAGNTFTALNPIPASAVVYYDPEYDDVAGNPFVNPLVEIGATMGIIGVVAFAFLLIRLVIAARGTGLRQKMAIAALAMFVGIALESTVLRHYIWFVVSIALISTPSRAPTSGYAR